MDEQNTAATLILTLSNGKTIVADVEHANGSYMCSNILEILEQYSEDGQVRMGLIKFMPYALEEGGLAVPTIMAMISVPGPELLAAHKKAFSKIITPDTQGIILPS
jgi:hypothetical protein